MTVTLDAVVFDFGGVLIDWNPQYFLGDYFVSDADSAAFMEQIDFHMWNEKMDMGMAIDEVCRRLKLDHPQHHHIFDAYEKQWLKTLSGPIEGTVDILRGLDAKNVPLYGITNYNQDTLRMTMDAYDFFQVFKGIIVSGEEKMIKPDPKIYQLLLKRYGLSAEKLLFIDDRSENIDAAKALGFHGHVFTTPEELARDLKNYDFNVGS